jgi:hypothetical protein
LADEVANGHREAAVRHSQIGVYEAVDVSGREGLVQARAAAILSAAMNNLEAAL